MLFAHLVFAHCYACLSVCLSVCLPVCLLQLPGWEDRGVGGPGDAAAEAAKQLSVDLETFDSVDELETMGERE
jgi:hypothetical protein